jgi:hypothetical protein
MRTFKFRLTRRGSRVHHAERYKISEEEFGGPIHRLDVVKHYLKGDMLVVKTLLNGVDKIKIILLNVVSEDKIEVILQMGEWRVTVEKSPESRCCTVLAGCKHHIDVQLSIDYQRMALSLYDRNKFMEVLWKSRTDPLEDDGYTSDLDFVREDVGDLYL